jgi:hypothetical protein
MCFQNITDENQPKWQTIIHYEHQNRPGSAFFFWGGGATSLIGIMSKDGTLPYIEIISSEIVHLNTMHLLETVMQKYVEMLSVCMP